MSNTNFRRAASAPPLPTKTVSFILYCVKQFRGWIALMLVLERLAIMTSVASIHLEQELLEAMHIVIHS